jgi:hypothetical protein
VIVQLKKSYLSFKTISNMSGAGWDETTKMVSLPAAVWKELALNKSASGCELCRWQFKSFPLFHDLAGLIEGNTANGELMETTEDDDNPERSWMDSNELASNPRDVPHEDTDEEDEAEEDTETTPAPPKSTPSAAKRKRGSAMSPDAIMGELRSMSSTLAQSMHAPIPPLVFTPSAPPPSVHMRAVAMVQKEESLDAARIFEAIDFLGQDNHAEVYVSLTDALRPTWLRMKLGW